MWISWKWFNVELQDSSKVYLIGAPNRLLQCLPWSATQAGTWQVEHVFQHHSRHGWTPSGVPSISTAPAGNSRSFPAIPASSAVCRCLQVRLLSKNHPSLECSPSGASGGRVIGGVQAVSAVTPVTSPCHVYTLHKLIFCTCSWFSSVMHCFHSAIAVHWDYRVARHPLEDIATYWTRTRTSRTP